MQNDQEVVQYWEQFDAEIDDIYDTASEEERAVLEEQRKMVEFTISALRQQEQERKTTTSEGLRCKYIVRKADTLEGVDGCFVLRPDRDRAAVAALRAYAAATDNDDLATDILNWVGHERNEPLPLDELRQMDGEPVWIKLFDPDEEFWVLRNEWVDTRNPEPLILFHMRWYSHADYGKTWLAYRRKPEEGSADG